MRLRLGGGESCSLPSRLDEQESNRSWLGEDLPDLAHRLRVVHVGGGLEFRELALRDVNHFRVASPRRGRFPSWPHHRHAFGDASGGPIRFREPRARRTNPMLFGLRQSRGRRAALQSRHAG